MPALALLIAETTSPSEPVPTLMLVDEPSLLVRAIVLPVVMMARSS